MFFGKQNGASKKMRKKELSQNNLPIEVEMLMVSERKIVIFYVSFLLFNQQKKLLNKISLDFLSQPIEN